MTEAKITVSGPGDSPLDRLLFGAWFWRTQINGEEFSGFARTEAKAHRKAERAATKLARRIANNPPETRTSYTIEVQP